MKFLLAIHIILFCTITPLKAQVVDSTSTDSTTVRIDEPTGALSDSATSQINELTTAQSDSFRSALKKKPKQERITPWAEMKPIGSTLITTDSLLRWQIWPNWGDYQAYRRDVLSFRQGTNGRVDAFQIRGYGPYEQELRMEGISINNPITGLANYNLVPHRKIGEATETFGGSYHSQIKLKDYYLLKPISYLNYDEADGAYRNLEFMVAQNFTPKTNLELSYWDRRGGNYYPNSGVEGSQVVGRVYHHLSDEFLIRGMYLRNQLSNDEPFGYNIGDPALFAFDKYGSQPLRSNGASEFSRWDLVGGIYHRKDTSSVEDAGFEISTSKNKYTLTSSKDSLYWDLRTFGGKLFKLFQHNKWIFRSSLSANYHAVNDGSALTETGWANLDAQASMNYQISEPLQLYGKAIGKSRSDGKKGFELTGGAKIKPSDGLKLNASVSTFSRIPTMQALYWKAKNYQGNPSLNNETGISATGNIDIQPTSSLHFGASGRWKLATGATFLNTDSSFTKSIFSNSSEFTQLSGMAYGRFENHRFEIESSGTVQQFAYSDSTSPLAALNHQDMILWLRNSAFIKGYVFDRAAFLKIGVKTLLSPFYYSAQTYNTELGFWQGNSTYQELPSFFRLDGELSVRLRGIMIVLRWENALDGLGQVGYFESAGFPMPPRRLIVGIRAQFRN